MGKNSGLTIDNFIPIQSADFTKQQLRAILDITQEKLMEADLPYQSLYIGAIKSNGDINCGMYAATQQDYLKIRQLLGKREIIKLFGKERHIIPTIYDNSTGMYIDKRTHGQNHPIYLRGNNKQVLHLERR